MKFTQWDEAQINRLIQLWNEGLSGTEIGRRMGVSKNAVLGKVHRLDLSSRPSPIIKGQPTLARKRQKRAPAITLAPLPQIQSAPMPQYISRVEFPQNHQCSWPIGEPRTKGFRFCDDHAVRAKPYCFAHCQLAYVQICID